jgi:regulator of sigma D
MSKPETERLSDTQEIVDKLLSERQEMLVMFCKLAGLQPYTHSTDAELLQRFCEVLVDYSAFGHFEIYERIVNGDEKSGPVVEVAREVYPRIAESSEFAVEFNDKYDAADHQLDIQDLDGDLSRLGEELAARIEMEDRIINAFRQ